MILIKSDHPYAYKRGEWGMIVDECYIEIKVNSTTTFRPCFDIIWLDGDVDVWPQSDPEANYQFMEVEDCFDDAS